LVCRMEFVKNSRFILKIKEHINHSDHLFDCFKLEMEMKYLNSK
jgi:hypothetical protein